MKLAPISTVLLLASATAFATDSGPSFSERVTRAKLEEQLPAPRAYFEQHLFPAMSSSMSKEMMKCLAKPNASREKFALVANISPKGSISDVDYLPKTNTAACFVEAFRTLQLPSPPKSKFVGLPIHIEFTLTE